MVKFQFVGLEGVEIIMAVEETFDIAIEDSVAEKLATPSQLIELVMNKVGRTSESEAVCLTQRAFHRLRASLMRQFDLKRNQIRPETLLANLFPRPTRKQRVVQMLTDIGSGKPIEFDRPVWLQRLILTAAFCGGVASAVLLAFHPISSKVFFMNFVLASPVVAGVLCFALFGFAGCLATRGMLIEFRPSMTTIGHLSRWLVANAPDVVKAPPGEWSREQVSEIVREIVIYNLGCEKEYREDAHFVKDLGMS